MFPETELQIPEAGIQGNDGLKSMIVSGKYLPPLGQLVGMVNLIRRILNAASHNTQSRPPTPARVHVKLNLAGLHRMRMRKLQMKLVRVVLHMRYDDREPAVWERLLDEYSKLLISQFRGSSVYYYYYYYY